MKVSLLVPVYGVERYIARCAESLFGQTYRDIEFIFVDDCTPDASITVLEKVLERFPERRSQVHIIRHEHNRGLGAARATAFEASTGDAVMHVDSDDYMALNAVEILCDRMEDTGAEVVDGGYARTMDGNVVDTHMPFHGRDEYYMCMLLIQNVYSNRIWGRLYRRTLYSKPYVEHKEGIDYGEDYAIVPKLLFKSRRRCVNEVVYYYNMDNGASYTHGISEKNSMSYIKAVAQIYSYIYDVAIYGEYSILAVQFGALTGLRHARKNNISMKVFYKTTRYYPTAILPRLSAFLFRVGCPYKIADAFFRMSRSLFIRFMKIVYRRTSDIRRAYWS